MDNLIKYCLRIADNSLILSHRLGEYSSHGPFLEEDLAITNLALDHIGLAESLLNHAAELEAKGRSGDDLAFKRAEHEYLNCQLVEHPNTDFAYIIARQFFTDVFNSFFYKELQQSANDFLKGLAQKSSKEVAYHLRRSSEWMIRLGKGTEESNTRIQKAVNNLWKYIPELFAMDVCDEQMIKEGIGVDLKKVHEKWDEVVGDITQKAAIVLPGNTNLLTNGKNGFHSEYLGHLLCDMQYLNVRYPDAVW